MKAIILSAGQGSRLGHLTAERPKCLIEFAGRSLLDRQLDTLAACGVDEAVVVTGFRDDQVEAALARRIGGPRVRTVFNPFYTVDHLLTVPIRQFKLAKTAAQARDKMDEALTAVADACEARASFVEGRRQDFPEVDEVVRHTFAGEVAA